MISISASASPSISIVKSLDELSNLASVLVVPVNALSPLYANVPLTKPENWSVSEGSVASNPKIVSLSLSPDTAASAIEVYL